MKFKAVLFDLDGTLLPMDQDRFTHDYFHALVKYHAPLGYSKEDMLSASENGIRAMVMNDGSRTNEAAYWEKFYAVFGEKAVRDRPLLDRFYEENFDLLRTSCGFDPEAAPAVRAVRSMGIKTVLATNPLFPAKATRLRMKWAGLTEEDFEFFTSYENSTFAKPSLGYYKEVLDRLGIPPRECLMVGNDAEEDLAATRLGTGIFFIDACLINKTGADISSYPHGTFGDLIKFIENNAE